jgi:hypothetical protein
MSDEKLREIFLADAEAWVCDGYSADIRYIASRTEEMVQIWHAAIDLLPLPAKHDFGFQIRPSNLSIGQVQLPLQKKSSLVELLSDASRGVVPVPSDLMTLASRHPLEYHSEMSNRERWFSQLHLKVTGSHLPLPSPTNLAWIDDALRMSRPPFDGLTDVAAWLGLDAPGANANPPSISIRIGPPCDLIVSECALRNDSLRLTLHAHPEFDTNRVGLSMRVYPGPDDALKGRQQVAGEIRWDSVRDGRRVGVAQIAVKRADQALAMLMIGGSTVRRNWFLDPEKARNNRLVAVQQFDKDLKQLKRAVLEAADPHQFERGVAALAFLLGFSPCIQLETDSPDLIVMTPGGRLLLIECTTRLADFSFKMGKLVDRRGAISKSLGASGHGTQVTAVLVCQLPRDQIATGLDELRANETILITHEDLISGFDRLRHTNDPDKMLNEALAWLAATETPLSG